MIEERTEAYGEHPELPLELIGELRSQARLARARLFDAAWDKIAQGTIPLFEGYKRHHS